MKIKKLLLLLVSGTILATSVAFWSAGAAFTDVGETHLYADAIEYLEDSGWVHGYGDGSFGPSNSISRAEFTKIVMEAGYEDLGGSNCFKDVTDGWDAEYVCAAAAKGYVKGYDDGNFRSNQNINFAEASKIIANVLELAKEDEDPELWFKNYVYALEDYAAIPVTVTSFDQNMNRGEMADIIYRIRAGVTGKEYNTYAGVASGVPAEIDFDSRQSFRSCSALGAYMHRAEFVRDLGGFMEDDMAIADSVELATPKSAEPTTGGGAPEEGDFSETNVQVEGVDEADIVKTDGQYIYFVDGGELHVVDATPASGLEELDSVNFDGDFSPNEMFVDGDRLVLIGQYYGPTLYPWEDDAVIAKQDVMFGGTVTRVLIYDISNKEDLEVVRDVEFDGYYESSRKIDEMVYVVSNEYNYYWGDPAILEEEIVPLYRDGDEVAPMARCGEIGYLPGPREDANFINIMGIDISDDDSELVNEVVLGNGGEIYSSRDNMYIASARYSWWGWEDFDEETVVHKFELGTDDISYKGEGKVPGAILNQFSMDEYDGNFRIATTTGHVWDDNSTNNVYILDEDLELIGSLEGLAPGETIYSVRFMGERGYMVTFKKIDPLFVFDLSDPSAPKVLGKLKIPGYSDYLHPFDEDHLIGFGKDATDGSEDEVAWRDLDFAWFQGIKVAMFDVSDVENPVELHKIEIGDRGTSSELLYNHKALLFDKAKGIMAFPVTVHEIPEDVKNDPSTPANTYGDPVFQGAYVYDVSVADGFDLRGTISHYDEGEIEDKAGYYWYGDSDIKRILYIGDYFYTVSSAMLKSSRMSDLADVDELEF